MEHSTSSNTGRLAAKYASKVTDRQTFLDRARECAKLTIPTLIPPSGHTKSTKYYTPYQGIGARGVNNLASKLLLAMLPINSPFFRLIVDDKTVAEMAGDPQARAKVEEALNQIERSVQTEVEGSGIRSPIFEGLKHLIIGGNSLMYLPAQGGIRVFRLDQYVVCRDPNGNVIDIIVEEAVNADTLSGELLKLIQPTTSPISKDNNEPTHNESKEELKLYTGMRRKDNQWHMHQELGGKEVPGSQGQWPLDKSPMIPLRWTRIDGEDYGRSYVEEYLGDLLSLEGLSKAIVEGAAASAKVLFLVNPNGTTKPKVLAEANNCDVVTGNAAEVTVLQVQKHADFSVAQTAAKEIAERLAFAFLMNTAIQRNAERVTAEEVRYVAGELEDALGGVYSILSQEFQLPLTNRLMDRMTKQGKLPKLPKGIVSPAIVTGLSALGRGHDLQKYSMFINALQPLGPEVIAQRMNVGDLITRIGTALMIDMKGLVKNDEQIAQETAQAQQQQQQAQMMELAKTAVPNATKGIADAMNTPPIEGTPPNG